MDISDNVYGCLCGFFLQMLFQDHEFFEPFQTVLQAFFIALRTIHGFSGISQILIQKNSVMDSGFINFAKRHI